MTDDPDHDPVERAARAAYEEAYDEPERAYHPWDTPWVKQAWLDVARAALAAAREGEAEAFQARDWDEVARLQDEASAARAALFAAPTVTTEQMEGAEAALRDLFDEDEAEGRDMLDVARLGVRTVLAELGIEVREP